MAGVQDYCAVLDRGAGYGIVCADDVEAEVRMVGRKVGQVPDLPSTKIRSCNGPWPVLRTLRQAGLHRIVFDISHDPVKFLLVADPVIIGFILPEWRTAASENLVGLTGAGVLDCASH